MYKKNIKHKRYLSTQPGGRYPGEDEKDKVFEYNGAPLAFHVPRHNKFVELTLKVGTVLVVQQLTLSDQRRHSC